MGNTVGSRGNLRWNTKEVREIRRRLKLSKIQKAVLIGLILGDGCLAENFWKKHFRLKIEQSDRHKEYIFWLYSTFKNWSLSGPKYLKERNAWRFYTLSHPEITKLRKIFYREKKKIIPVNIEEFFTYPISLAVWFMDDGGVKSDKTNPTISSYSFSGEENERLIKCLQKNFNLKVNLNWDGNGCRLYIPKGNIKRFLNLVSPYILPSMKYKFPLTP